MLCFRNISMYDFIIQQFKLKNTYISLYNKILNTHKVYEILRFPTADWIALEAIRWILQPKKYRLLIRDCWEKASSSMFPIEEFRAITMLYVFAEKAPANISYISTLSKIISAADDPKAKAGMRGTVTFFILICNVKKFIFRIVTEFLELKYKSLFAFASAVYFAMRLICV